MGSNCSSPTHLLHGHFEVFAVVVTSWKSSTYVNSTHPHLTTTDFTKYLACYQKLTAQGALFLLRIKTLSYVGTMPYS
jgi:hypothetical protein